MSKIRLRFMAAGAAMLMMSAAGFADPQQVKGIIVTNQNGQLTVKTEAGNQTIQIGGDAKIQSVGGPFGAQKDDQTASALIPGLPISVVGDDSTGRLVASKIEYKASDFKTAAQIQAGVEATANKEAQLRQAYSQLGEFEVRNETAVYFKTGSASISAAGRKSLEDLASQAQGIQGYVISVLGYADPTGSAGENQRLSNERAQNVINLLKQSSGIQPGRVLAASAMGEAKVSGAADPTTYSSARRVVVRVLTSKGQLPPGQ
jgi:OmpA-OmpF porin, OOP family